MAIGRVQLKIVAKLHEMEWLSDDQFEDLKASQNDYTGEELDTLLLNDYHVSDFQLLIAKSHTFGLPPFRAKEFRVTEFTFEKLDKDFCLEKKLLPIGTVGGYVLIAISNPFELSIINDIQHKTNRKVMRFLGLESDILSNLQDDLKKPSIEFGDVVDALGMEYNVDEDIDDDELADEDSAPIIQLANRIIEDAYFSGGSDIHIEPSENDCRVRVRVDGVCQVKLTLPQKVTGSLIARLKVMADLDIAEKRKPQDGRIIFKQFTRKPLDIDLRVSSAPLNHGEGMVMRILDKQKSTLPLPALGFSAQNLSMYRELIRQPYGMVLHCGPTGSGKSMTLYSALNEINTPDTVIRTAEDPIEYTLDGLCQMQMNRKIGLTFAAALRSFLRQDPDIILVGEIRDIETAGIAVEAALTGHMLFSTLHTNDAPSTVARLSEMGVEPFMISASLVCICAQRLMRRICKTCGKVQEPTTREAEILQRAIGWSGQIRKANPNGCPNCNSSGYKGRVGIHELMPTSKELVAAINARVETATIKQIAMKNNMKTLHQDSMLKVQEGVTTMEESISTVPPDMELSDEFEADQMLLENAGAKA
ncbi:MAG: GspE/PulE family protein [Verrucomicrobia bacterium]|nr:GspE/PulE family protein [Verrucomicrobiota bacterium]MDA1069457.1 GspE/PulE family protein [Verrucomicrobiota bacterium]